MQLKAWLADRFGIGPVQDHFLRRRVPKTPWYQRDGVVLLFLIGILFVTGPILALSYSPAPQTAYRSIVYITEVQPLGWLLRALHYWAAGLCVVMMVFHLLRQILIAGYKFPREGTWLIGVMLFFAILVMSVSGYTLRWDERAVYAIKVVLFHFSRVPLIGDQLVILVQGGMELGALTLTRFYAVHTIIVPALIAGLIAYHLYLVVIKGITSRAERHMHVHSVEEQHRVYHAEAQSEKGEEFYPDTTAKEQGPALLFVALALGLSFLLGAARLYPEANLVLPTQPIEEWWWAWYSALIALAPPAIAYWLPVAFPVLLFLALVSLPFIDRSPRRGIRQRPWAVALVSVVVISLVSLTALRWISPWGGWPSEQPPPPPPGFELSGRAEEGRLLFARYGCNSCHQVAGVGPPAVGTDLARMKRRLSPTELRHYIELPPEGIPMPSFEGRIPDEDLERIVAYVLAAQTFPRDR